MSTEAQPLAAFGAPYVPVFAHDDCDVEPVEPLDPSLLVDPTVASPPGAIADCEAGLGALPPLPPASPGCPTIEVDPGSDIVIDEESTSPTMTFTVTPGGACSFNLLLGITIPPTAGGGGGGVTVNYVDGSTLNVDASTLNVTNNSTFNVDASTFNVTNNSTFNVDAGSVFNMAGNLVITGPVYQPPHTFASWTSNQTNLSLSGVGNVRLRVASDEHYRELRSIAPGASPSGRIVYFHNVGDYVILIKHDDAGSTEANRILTSTENDYFLAPGHCVALVYDATSERWRVSENSDERLEAVHDYGDEGADIDNWEIYPYVKQHRINPTVDDIAITGVKYGRPGLRHRLINSNSVNGFYLLHSDLGSDAANRFLLAGGQDIRVPPRGMVEIEYDGVAENWRALHLTSAADTVTLTINQIGYGDASDLLTGSDDFTRIAAGQVYLATESDSVSPNFVIRRRRAGPAAVANDDIVGTVLFQAYLLGDSPQAYVRCRYTGDGTLASGQLEIGTYNGVGTAGAAVTIDTDGYVYLLQADDPLALVVTGADGELVNGTVASPYLTLSGGVLTAKCDLLAPLHAAAIAVSANATATISRVHYLSGAGCTLTLPGVSGNTGKLLGIHVSPAATGLFTIDGAADTIDGQTTRIMWAGESAILLCDGAGWFKIAGKSIPMIGKAQNNKSLGAYDAIAHATLTVVPLDATVTDNTGLMVDLANDRLTCKRSGNYISAGFVQFCGTNAFGGVTAAGTRFLASFAGAQPEVSSVSGSVPAVGAATECELTAGSHYQLSAYQDTGVGQFIGSGVSNFALVELPTW